MLGEATIFRELHAVWATAANWAERAERAVQAADRALLTEGDKKAA